MRPVPGVHPRHSRSCPVKGWEPCRCEPSYQAHAWAKKDEARIRKTFSGPSALADAKAWRLDTLHGLKQGTMRAPTRDTLAQASVELLDGMKSGVVRSRNRKPFKPSAIRSYELSLKNYLLPEWESVRLANLTRNDVQDFVDALLSQGLDPSTVRNVLMPLRVIYRRAVRRGVVMFNPTQDLELPAVTGKRDRVASPAEAVALLAALLDADKPAWATAMYAGPRRGELWALPAEKVDLEAGLIHVERSWDRYEGDIDLKSEAGKRIVPICDHLRQYLQPKASGFYFGSESEPFNYDALIARAKKCWKDAGLQPITLHECRHSFSTFLDAAGISETRADRYMGHANPSVANRYRHPTQYTQDAALLDEYLTGAEAGKIVALEGRAA